MKFEAWPGIRLGNARRDLTDVTLTELAAAITPDADTVASTYQGLSNFEHGRRGNVRRGIGTPQYIDALVRLSGKTPKELGIDDLVEKVRVA